MKTTSTGQDGSGNESAPISPDHGNRHAVHFSSATDEWATPPALFDWLQKEFLFDLDVCATPQNAKCDRFFTKADDGLQQDWGRSTSWMNPPYGREISLWMRKAFESSQNGATVVCLVPARTDTEWWHRFAVKGEIRFLRGRLKFGDADTSAPFPSAIVIFRPPVNRIVGASMSETKGEKAA